VIVVGPQTLTAGVGATINDPAQGQGNPSQGCQIQNSSSYQLNVLAEGDVLSIQPFTAQTVAISGQPMVVTPIAGTGVGVAPITFVFLLGTAPGNGVELSNGLWIEAPPQQDGPLTAAAIAAATQGSVDLLYQSGSYGTLAANTPTIVPFNPPPGPSTAPAIVDTLKAYQSVVVNVSWTTGAAGSLTAQAVCFAGQIFFPAQTLATKGAATGVSFILPCAYSIGDLLEIILTSTTAMTGVNVTILGLTEQAVQEVIAPPGNPVSTAPRGGALHVNMTQLGVTGTQILAAPPAGFSYRLHRWVTVDTGPALLTDNGATTFIGYATAAASATTTAKPVDDLQGLVWTAQLNFLNLNAGNARASLFYDLIPTPTVS